MKHWTKIRIVVVIDLLMLFCHGSVSLAAPCIAPDNGSGTVNLPANCPYIAPFEPMYIIDGLPPGTTIELDPILDSYLSIVRTPGGSLGGEIQQFDATLDLTVAGTGDLTGFNRHLAVPVSIEVHTAPRTAGDPMQLFPTVLFRLQGELFGDPDFCTFVMIGGTDYGLPSPGQTTLTELPSGDFAVDSFFDITYQIQFEGCPGSQLEDYMGTTTATIHVKQGDGVPPATGACCTPDEACEVVSELYCQNISGTYYGDGSQCLGDNNGDGKDDLCLPVGCCRTPDNGSGTVNLPANCPYIAPFEPMYIIDGLPPGTTIELDPILDSYLNIVRTPGGSLGGEIQQFDATLDLTLAGTGDLTGFNRHLAVPVSIEVHTAPRTAGDPVQLFPTVLFRLQGELFGDPDFCTFMMIGGTDYGLPSPGQTTLTELPSGDFAVDSFFDITYQIQFEGCPGSQLEDYMGTTTGSIRWQQGLATDDDGDCISNNEDNCPNIHNPNQFDTYPPPQGNGIGDACDCEGNFNCDANLASDDVSLFLLDTGRNIYNDPCTNGNPCNGDFGCDGSVDSGDVAIFIEDTGRNTYNNPCPFCDPAVPWCVYP